MLWTITVVAWLSDGPRHLWPHTKRECMAASDPDCPRIRTDHCFFRGAGRHFSGELFFAQLLLVPGLFLVGNNLWNNFLNKAWIVESTHLMLLSPVDTFHNFFGHFCWGNFFGNHLPTPTPSNCVIHIPANYSFAFWIRFFEGVLDCVISSFHLLS